MKGTSPPVTGVGEEGMQMTRKTTDPRVDQEPRTIAGNAEPDYHEDWAAAERTPISLSAELSVVAAGTSFGAEAPRRGWPESERRSRERRFCGTGGRFPVTHPLRFQSRHPRTLRDECDERHGSAQASRRWRHPGRYGGQRWSRVGRWSAGSACSSASCTISASLCRAGGNGCHCIFDAGSPIGDAGRGR